MRFFLDEGISPVVSTALQAVFVSHVFINTWSEGLAGTKDVPLFGEITRRGVDVFVTLDGAQRRVGGEELAAVKSSRVHWLGLAQPSARGMAAIARQTASLLVAIAALTEDPPEEPTAFRIKAAGRQPGQIFSSRRLIDDL